MTGQVFLPPRARASELVFRGGTREIAPDLAYKRLVMVNVVFVGVPGCGDRGWVLIDAGLAGTASAIEAAAVARFGVGARPAAIILTHGHFDHVGALEELALRWDVPVHAHELETPYLDGSASYPPGDPSVGGGLVASLAELYPTRPVDVTSRLRALPADGTVPPLPGWTWLHTPGHAPGHVSLWREADRTMIVGDAFVTTAQESILATAFQSGEMHGPPRYFTIDWDQARASVQALSRLGPDRIVTGHGRAMQGPAMRQALAVLARDFDLVARPARGRYLSAPARAEDSSAYRPTQPASPRHNGRYPMRPRHKPLSEQVIVITGSSSGIGLATARMASERGATVVLVARASDTLAGEQARIEERGGRAIHIAADVGSRAELQRVAERAVAAFGGFDTWVNVAGATMYGNLTEVSEEDSERLMRTNFWGTVNGSLVAVEHLRQKGGSLVNVGSVASDVAFPLQGMYVASKHAVKGFTEALRMELLQERIPIGVSLIKPASIDTPIPQRARNYMTAEPSLPPPLYRPEEVAEAILHAAVHPRRDIYVGSAAAGIASFEALAPGLYDLLAPVISAFERRDERPRNPGGALHRSRATGEVRGDYRGFVRQRSYYTRAGLHPVATTIVAAGLTAVASVLLNRVSRART